MRLIDADALKIHNVSADYYYDVQGATEDDIDDAPTINAIPIPQGATNGDIIKAMFPNIDDRYLYDGILMDGVEFNDFRLKVSDDWWNALYQREEKRMNFVKFDRDKYRPCNYCAYKDIKCLNCDYDDKCRELSNIKCHIIEIEPRKCAHWIERGVADSNDNRVCECSSCHHTDTQSKSVKVPFCWFCGAKMVEKEVE